MTLRHWKALMMRSNSWDAVLEDVWKTPKRYLLEMKGDGEWDATQTNSPKITEIKETSWSSIHIQVPSTQYILFLFVLLTHPKAVATFQGTFSVFSSLIGFSQGCAAHWRTGDQRSSCSWSCVSGPARSSFSSSHYPVWQNILIDGFGEKDQKHSLFRESH